MTAPRPHLSLQRKSAARLAAVQCLYQQAISGAPSPAAQVASLKAKLADNRDEQKLLVGQPIEPHYPLVETLLEGVAGRRDDIDRALDGVLKTGWKRERMGPLLVAVLHCGIFELLYGKEVKPRIVIDEYTRLSAHFFTDAEIDFVHAALSTLAERHG